MNFTEFGPRRSTLSMSALTRVVLNNKPLCGKNVQTIQTRTFIKQGHVIPYISKKIRSQLNMIFLIVYFSNHCGHEISNHFLEFLYEKLINELKQFFFFTTF